MDWVHITWCDSQFFFFFELVVPWEYSPRGRRQECEKAELAMQGHFSPLLVSLLISLHKTGSHGQVHGEAHVAELLLAHRGQDWPRQWVDPASGGFVSASPLPHKPRQGLSLPAQGWDRASAVCIYRSKKHTLWLFIWKGPAADFCNMSCFSRWI